MWRPEKDELKLKMQTEWFHNVDYFKKIIFSLNVCQMREDEV